MSTPEPPAMSREQLDRLFRNEHGLAAGGDATPSGARPSAPRPARQASPAAADRVTSDLSIDETLLLHSIGWEPVDMVIGAAVGAIPPGTFTLGYAASDRAATEFANAVAHAVTRIREDCRRAGGAGVVGVKVDFEVHRNVVRAVLVGTAVRPSTGSAKGPMFVSDLSTRDFCLLHGAGWAPLGLAFGTAFVQVPYRSAGTFLKQMTANVELTNLTQALYLARDRAMERLQESALAMGAGGVVAVQIIDRPLHFASHVSAFTAWGTAVRLTGDAHVAIRPRMVVPMDDAVDLFDVAGAMGPEG